MDVLTLICFMCYSNLYFRPLRNSQPLAVREVKGQHLGRLITVRGIVTRVSEVKPLLQVSAFSCDSCGCEVFQEVDKKSITPLSECVSEDCKQNNTRGKLHLQTRACKFTPFQEVKMQEMVSRISGSFFHDIAVADKLAILLFRRPTKYPLDISHDQ